MNITRKNIDELNVVLTVDVEKADYAEQVEKVLKNHRKKAVIKGFRPGMAPVGLIKSMYGTAILVDEVNKLVSEKLRQFIVDEKLEILGEPLPSASKKSVFNPETDEKFEFSFDLGLRPEFELKLSKRDKLPFYLIKVDDKMIDDTIASHTQRLGRTEEAESVIEKDLVRGDFEQLDAAGNLLDGGIVALDSLFAVDRIVEDSIRNKVVGAKLQDSIVFDIKKAFENDGDLASMLRIDKNVAETLTGNFKFTIKKISRYIPSEVNQELWDGIYGPGAVNSEKEYRDHVIADIKTNFLNDSDFRFGIDAKEKLAEKLGLKLPDAFMKRWLVETNENLTEVEVERDYAAMQTEITWQLIKSKIAEEHQLKVEADDILGFAKQSVDRQFRQYGMALPEEQLENYAKNQLQNEETRRKLIDQLFDQKVVGFIKESVKLDEKEVSVEEFNELFTKK